jgi:mono/diheme cytochrome c family protein
MSDRPSAKPYRDGYVEPGPDLDVRQLHDAIIREKSEPRDGYEPIPLWLIFTYFGIIGWTGVYLGLYNGGFDPNRYNQEPGGVAVAVDAAPVKIDPLVLGKRLYANCISCHQSSGLGVAGQYPPHAGSEWVVNDPETPIRILLNGLDGPIDVKGNTFNAAMPAFGGRFTDEQIAAVLTYIRQEWGNDAPPVDPALVTAVRGLDARSGTWTAEALEGARATTVEWTPTPSEEPASPEGDGTP